MQPLVIITAIAAAAIAIPWLVQRYRHQQAQAAARLRRDDHLVTELADSVSSRLYFRRPEQHDRDFLIDMAGDETAAHANGWADDQVDVIRSIVDKPKTFATLRRGELLAIDRSNDRPVGLATFATSPIEPKRARTLGVHVHPTERGKGYGVELTAAALLVLRATPGAIHVATSVDNTGMQRIMATLGYHPEPQTMAYRAPNGTEFDSYWYECGTGRPPPVLPDRR